MPQFGRPTADVTVGNWGPSPLWQRLAEMVPDDAGSEISSGNNPASDVAEVLLSPLGVPVSTDAHRVRWRAKKTGGKAAYLDVYLFQGAVQIAGSQITTQLTTGYTTQVASYAGLPITDYRDLRIRLVARTSGGGSSTTIQVTWVELEIPDAAPPPPEPLRAQPSPVRAGYLVGGTVVTLGVVAAPAAPVPGAWAVFTAVAVALAIAPGATTLAAWSVPNSMPIVGPTAPRAPPAAAAYNLLPAAAVIGDVQASPLPVPANWQVPPATVASDQPVQVATTEPVSAGWAVSASSGLPEAHLAGVQPVAALGGVTRAEPLLAEMAAVGQPVIAGWRQEAISAAVGAATLVATLAGANWCVPQASAVQEADSEAPLSPVPTGWRALAPTPASGVGVLDADPVRADWGAGDAVPAAGMVAVAVTPLGGHWLGPGASAVPGPNRGVAGPAPLTWAAPRGVGRPGAISATVSPPGALWAVPARTSSRGQPGRRYAGVAAVVVRAGQMVQTLPGPRAVGAEIRLRSCKAEVIS